MPASNGMIKVSQKTLDHLKRVNSSEKSIATRFKTGGRAWNSQNIFITCLICKKEVKTILSRKEKHKFCSKICASSGKLSPKMNEVINLYKAGLKMREISVQLNKPLGTIGGMIYRYNIKNRFGHPEFNKTIIKRQLPNFCELCGYTRVIELAHIIPRSKGGQHRISNYLSLCPNCHYLFDQNLLVEEERIKISKVIEVRRYAS